MKFNNLLLDRTDLVQEFLFDGDGNDTGGSNNGTVSNGTWVASSRSYTSEALSFNGTSTQVTSGFPLAGTEDFSYEFWYQYGSSTGAYQILKDVGVGASTSNRHFIAIDRDYNGTSGVAGQINMFTTDGTAANFGPTSNPGLDDGEWHHIVITRTGSTGEFYIDGVSVSVSGTVRSGDVQSSNQVLGRLTSATTRNFNGDMGVWRLYDAVLTADQVTALYQEGLRALGPTDLIPTVDRTDMVLSLEGDSNGSTWYDSSGNGNNGTLTNVTEYRKGLTNIGDFSSNGDRIEVTDSASLDITGNMSISAWVTYDTLVGGSTQQAICRKTSAYTLRLENSNINFYMWGTTASSTDGYAISNLNTDQWYHIVATYDGSNKYIYVDGEQVFSAAVTGTISTSANNLFVGANDASSGSLQGDMGLVRIYDAALSSDEIKKLYQEGLRKLSFPRYSLPSLQDEKQLEYSLPIVSGTYYDQTGNGSNGTNSGTTESQYLLDNFITFDGTNDYIDITNLKSNIATATTGALWFWCNMDTDTNSDDTFVNMTYAAGNQVTDFVVDIDWRAGPPADVWKVSMRIDSSNKWAWKSDADKADETIGKWTMFGISHNGTEPTFYINGVEHTGSFNVTTDKTAWWNACITSATNKVDEIYFGAWRNNGTFIQHIDGDVSKINFTTKALSAEEMQQIYYSGYIPTP